jgi:hypothetical protein
MTLAPVIFVLLGVALIIVMMLAGRWSSEDSPPAIPEEDPALYSFSRDAADPLLLRIFSASDLQFVQCQNSPRTLQLFRRERKRLALLFIGELRARTRQIKTLHALAARRAANPNPGAEVQIALGYFFILFLTGVLSLLIQIFGISAIRFLAAPASALAARLSRLAQVSQSVRDVPGKSASR